MGLVDLLLSSKFEEALDALKNGEKIPAGDRMFANNQSNIFDKLLKQKAFDILNIFVKNKTIETDVYEFERFDKSIFSNIVRSLQDDPESIDFFKQFIAHFTNINDEVSGVSLLGYFFDEGAHLNSIQVLVDVGCDVNYKNRANENLIYRVTSSRLRKFSFSDEDIEALQASYIEILVDKGLYIDEGNIVKKTALRQAVENNKKGLLDVLLKHGANPNEEDSNGESAFFYAAARLMDGDMYKKLREVALPQFDTKNKNEVSLFFEFIRMMDVSPKSLELMKQLIEDGADLYQANIYYGEEKTPLDLLAEKPLAALQAAFETGKVEINQQDKKGNTLLHKVCGYNINYDQEMAKDTYRKVKFLLENGADPSISNDSDKTAMMLASGDDLKIKTVELLITKK